MSIEEYRSQGKKKRSYTDHEHQEQVAIFEWAEIMSNAYPELELLHAIPNGGVRGWQTAKKLKAEGVKAGVPDIFLPVSKEKYHGLYIELKYGKNTTSDAQKWWISRLTTEGYLVKTCYGADEAIHLLSEYLLISDLKVGSLEK